MDSALKYYEAGYTPITANLTVVDGTKRFRPHAPWKTATHDNCLQQHVREGGNCHALITGLPSDLVVVDLDVGKEGKRCGVTAWQSKEPASNAPIVFTPTGGMHLYYSLSKSVAAGLNMTANTTDVSVDDEEGCTSIDVRAEGGVIIAPPTQYEKGSYRAAGQWPVPTKDLPALPAWFISVLNKRVSQPRSMAQIIRINPREMNAVVTQAIPEVEKVLGNKVVRHFLREGGFDIDVMDRSIPCTCMRRHDHNMWKVRIVLPECFTLRNYSGECKSVLVGWENQDLLTEVLRFPDTDNVYAHMYHRTQQHYGRDFACGNDGLGFHMYDGGLWKPVNAKTVSHEILELAESVLCETRYGLLGLRAMAEATGNETLVAKIKEYLKAISIAQKYLKKSRNIKSIVAAAEYLMLDDQMHTRMDADPNLLGTRSGVLNLQTGQLRTNKDYVSMSVTAEWKGLDTDTSQINRFFMDLFADDAEAVQYLQRLLGYGLTGRVDNDVMLVCWGVGSNGKSALMKLITELLGPYAGSMARECVVKSDRPTSAGGPSPHLAKLHKLRIAICEETDEGNCRLDDGVIKQMTGGSRMMARELNKNYFEFTPTHLPVLVTNHLPTFSADDGAMSRRLLLVPFNTKFRAENCYDPSDPTQKLLDPRVRMWVATDEAKEQMLVWLVKGAIAWYQQGLGQPPTLFASATAEYMQDNDLLGNFLNDHCIKGPGLMVESKAMLTAFNSVYTERPLTSKVLKHKMLARGFVYKQIRTVEMSGIYIKGVALQ